METNNINNAIFRQAINALDAGRLHELQGLVNDHPGLVHDRLITPGTEGYFKDPYLLWFVADNPIRNPRLPDNIVEITRFLTDAVERCAPDTYLQQLDYTLGLVTTGRIPRECGVQIPMMDALIGAGAAPGNAMGAIANGNIEAANHLIDRGGELTFASALLLDRDAGINGLMNSASDGEKLLALTAAAFYGKADKVKYLLDVGVDPNGYPEEDTGFHTHATPLHQAVSAVSIEVVKLLVDAGARLDLPDKIYDGAPLDWAIYLQKAATSEREKAAYAPIVAYLKEAENI